jgi:hypothetical protein
LSSWYHCAGLPISISPLFAPAIEDGASSSTDAALSFVLSERHFNASSTLTALSPASIWLSENFEGSVEIVDDIFSNSLPGLS